MKTIILAGGEGTRLRPLTSTRPKPMIRILDKPLLEWTLMALKEQGIRQVTIALRYMGNVISDYFGDGSDLDMEITYFKEDEDIGTAGCVAKIMDGSQENCLVLCGDALTDVEYVKVVDHLQKTNGDAVIALTKSSDPTRFGCVNMDKDGKITGFMEKPSWGMAESTIINTGIYVLTPKAIDMIPKDEAVDFGSQFFPAIIKAGANVFGYQFNSYWKDIGDPESYLDGVRDAVSGKLYLSGRTESRDNIPGVKINPPVFVGKNVSVGEGSEIGPNTCLSGDINIKGNCKITNSAIDMGVAVLENSNIDGACICKDALIGAEANINYGVCIGDGCHIGDKVTITENVKIWPDHYLEGDAIIRHSIYDPSCSTLIDWRLGEIFGDISSQTMVEIGTRIGQSLAYGMDDGVVALGTDGSREGELLSDSIAIGIRGMGISVIKVTGGIMPAFRHAVAASPAAIGLYIHRSKGEGVRFVILDYKGRRLVTSRVRKICQTYKKNDFESRICHVAGQSVIVGDAEGRYLSKLLRNIGSGLNLAPFGILALSHNPSIAIHMSSIIRGLGIKCIPILLGDNEGVEGVLDRMSYHHGAMAMLFGEKGENVTLVTSSGKVIDPERLRLLYASTLGGQFKRDFPVCENSSYLYTKIKDLRLLYTSCDLCDREALVSDLMDQEWLSDGLLVAMRLLAYTKKRGITLDKLDETVKQTTFRQVEIPIKSKADLVERMSKWHDLMPGVKGKFIRHKNGWAYICTDDYRDVVRITAEAMSAEIADQIILECAEHLE